MTKLPQECWTVSYFKQKLIKICTSSLKWLAFKRYSCKRSISKSDIAGVGQAEKYRRSEGETDDTSDSMTSPTWQRVTANTNPSNSLTPPVNHYRNRPLNSLWVEKLKPIQHFTQKVMIGIDHRFFWQYLERREVEWCRTLNTQSIVEDSTRQQIEWTSRLNKV